MPRYVIERNVGEVSKEDLEAAGRRANEVVAEMDGVKWVRSYISTAEGKIYCEYEAPDPEAILEHARRTGLPADKISEIEMEVHPAMFM